MVKMERGEGERQEGKLKKEIVRETLRSANYSKSFNSLT